MVVWKKALFFGGAIVLLSACDQSVTAPTGLSRVEGTTAAARAPSTSTTTTKTTKRTTAMDAGMCTDSTGVIIKTGDDPSCAPIIQ